MTEPEVLRKGLPWSHPNAFDGSAEFDYERDENLMHQLAAAIQKHL